MVQCCIDSVIIVLFCLQLLCCIATGCACWYCHCYTGLLLFCLCSVFIIPPLCAGQWGTTIIGVAAGELEWCSTSVLLFLVSFYVHSMCFMSILTA